MTGDTNGCPVQHSARGPAEVVPAVGNGLPAPTLREGTGRWSRVAAWLPFRGGDSGSGASTCAKKEAAGGANSAAGGDASAGGSSSAAAAAVQKVDPRKEDHGGGGCPMNSSDDDGQGATLSSGCPVQHDSAAPAAAPAAGGLGKIWGYLTGGGGGGDGVSDSSSAAAAPPAPASAEYNAMNNEYVYGQEVAAGQEMPLSTSRQRSSIPKANFNPDHQPKKEAEKWVYP
ncbi:unnamed protein product, partial [Hapterophycus canaliculatus]